MAVFIETATASPDAVGVSPGVTIDGFSAGVPQAGVAPTQFSPKWCNAVMGELNYIVNNIHAYDNPITLTCDDDGFNSQVTNAINERFVSNYPKSGVSNFTFEWRSQYHSNPAAAEWKVLSKSDHLINQADDDSYNLCPIRPPDDSVFFVEYTITVTNVATLADRCLSKMTASGSRAAGVTQVYVTNGDFDDNQIAELTWTVDVDGLDVVAKIDIGVNGNRYNIFVKGELQVVTKGT